MLQPSDHTHYLWAEKYRPTKVEDLVLPEHIKAAALKNVEGGQLPNMLFSGTGGIGKTSLAKALCGTLNLSFILVNGSDESGIDTVRNKIKQFASAMSLGGGYKVIIFDEADGLTPTAQGALREIIDEFSSVCRFIFTCNFKNKIIKPLHSRCTVIDFNTTKKDMVGLAAGFHKRLMGILDAEGVKYDPKVIAELIIKHAPDWRRIINECQQYASRGEITSDILLGISDESVSDLIKLLKDKDFKSMRSWIVNNTSTDSTVIFRRLYDLLGDYAKPECIPSAVLIIAEYSYKDAFVADKEINTCACLTELMSNLNWK